MASQTITEPLQSDDPPQPADESPASLQDGSAESLSAVWPGRLARALVVLVWPLVWIGGLVTTYDAGMSVPDWPGTYGYNLFAYPLTTWLFGPFDLLIEHGHRLLASLVGLVAIGFLVVTWRQEDRRWMHLLAASVLVLVIAQGVLGGLRVTRNARVLAMVHGCIGPAFFCLCVVAACATGKNWGVRRVLRAAGSPGERQGSKTPWTLWAILLVGLAYWQLVLGAKLRHALPGTPATSFAMTIAMHVLSAFVLWLLTALVWGRMRISGDGTLTRPALMLIGLVGVQIALGIGSWIVNYGYPSVLLGLPGSDSYLLKSKDVFDAAIVTGHVATGSLILAISTLLAVRLERRRFVLKQ